MGESYCLSSPPEVVPVRETGPVVTGSTRTRLAREGVLLSLHLDHWHTEVTVVLLEMTDRTMSCPPTRYL